MNMVTRVEPKDTTTESAADDWDREFAKLRERFPGASDGVLFCIHKLQQNPDVKLKDFQAEAELHGITVKGLSIHGARRRLGFVTTRKKSERSPKSKPTSTTTHSAQDWKDAEPRLRREFPDSTDGILFCIFKLRQEPSLTIPSFRDEALEHGIKLGGRALHSAKVLLGMAASPQTAPERRRTSAAPARALRSGNGHSATADLSDAITNALRELQEQATEESRRLRKAIEQAIETLQHALVGTTD